MTPPVHVVMPFKRQQNTARLIDHYAKTNAILHPLNFSDEEPMNSSAHFVESYSFKRDNQYLPCARLINLFIKNAKIIDEHYYVQANDDEVYEYGVFEKIGGLSDGIVIISMKRGYQIPKVSDRPPYPIDTIVGMPENVAVGKIGGEQVFVKGRIFKTLIYDEKDVCRDGIIAVELKSKYNIRYEPELFCLFNYLEPGRWDTNVF